MSKAIYRVEQEIAVREMGWEKADGWWVKPGAPRKYLELSQVLHFEWRDACARAGRADHLRDRLLFRINLLIALLTISLLVNTFLFRLLSV